MSEIPATPAAPQGNEPTQAAETTVNIPVTPEPVSPSEAEFIDIGLHAQGGLSLEVEVERLNLELNAAVSKLAETQDAYVRAVAETENLRRRASEDVSKAHKFAIESFAEALIPAKDSLEMALALQNQTLETLREGVEATLRQMTAGFEKGRLQEINPMREKFDPHRHQAVSMVPGNSVEPPVPSNHVVMVLQKGYLIADRVLRPALVAVAQ
jgi:molecular chaperone GrpE